MRRAITTLISGSPEYIDMLKVFLFSLSRIDDDASVFAYVVNGNKDVDGLRALNPNTTIIHQIILEPTPIKILFSRLGQIQDTLNKAYDQVASIDADVIFRGGLQGLWAGMRDNSFSFWDKGKTLPLDKVFSEDKARAYLDKKAQKLNTRLQGGVLVFGNGEHIKKYWQGVIDKIPENPDGYCIQRVPYLELGNHEHVRVVPLSSAYNDSSFQKHSVIWHGKGGHRSNPKWKKEFNSYLSQANKILQEE